MTAAGWSLWNCYHPSVLRSWRSDDKVLVIILELCTPYALKMHTLLNGRAWADLEPALGAAFFESSIQKYCDHATGAAFFLEVNELLDLICLGHFEPRYQQFNTRFGLALPYIQQSLSKSIRLEDIASLIQLSVDRTQHFFIEQMHVSFAQYLLWKRLGEKMAVVVGQGLNMQITIRKFGFTDQLHFTRMFKRFFGVSPSQIVRDCAIS